MRNKLIVLQQLRAVAALLVVVDHSLLYTARFGLASEPLENFAWHIGALGVSIFFVISGFIIAHSSVGLFADRSGIQVFTLKRFIRIVPMYWLATLLEISVRSIHHNAPSSIEVAKSLLFIPYAIDPGQPLRPVLTVGWTLNHEIFFYVLFASALMFPRNVGLMLVTSSLVILVAAGSLFKSVLDTTYPTTVLTFWLNPIILLFGAGVAIEFVTKRLPSSLTKIPMAGAAALTFVGAAVALFPLINASPWPIGWQLVVWILCVLSVGCAAVSQVENEHPFLHVIEILGNASYSIYLFHFIVIAGVRRVWFYLVGDSYVTLFVITSILAATVAGLLIHLFVERPLVEHLRTYRNKERGVVG